MKASHLIEKLQLAIAVRGDLVVTVQDGLDPSDENPVQEVEYSKSYFFMDGHGNKHPHFYLR